MPRESQGKITYPQLKRFLIGLGFEEPAAVHPNPAFVHRKSGTVLILSSPTPSDRVRPADLLSVLVRLEHEGLASEDVLQQFRLGNLPKAS